MKTAVEGTKIQLEMVDSIMCPGCIHGTDPEDCSEYKLHKECGFFVCKNWRPSTFMGGVGRIALGLPRGFCRTGRVNEFGDNAYLRLYASPEEMQTYDKFNVPVWAMERDGYLYVRVYSPRINCLFVDVIKGGKMKDAGFKDESGEYQSIDAGKFYDNMD